MHISDWSSYVCSSDLRRGAQVRGKAGQNAHRRALGRFEGEREKPHGKAGGGAGGTGSQRVADRRRLADQGKVTLGSHRTDASGGQMRSEEHTSELQSLMRISYAVFCLKKKKKQKSQQTKVIKKTEQETT